MGAPARCGWVRWPSIGDPPAERCIATLPGGVLAGQAGVATDHPIADAAAARRSS